MTEPAPAEEPAATGAESGSPDYEGLLLRAGFNYHVFIAAAFGFAREHGTAPDAFITSVAKCLAPTWRGLQGHGADAVLNLVLENLASTGYAVHDVAFGTDESTAEIDAIPLGLDAEQWQRLLEPFAVTPDDMHALFRVFIPLAAAAGAMLELAGKRDALRLTVRRDPGAPRAEPHGHEH
jgi:hypothetical protein